MKKFWSFGLMVLCLASLSGCESITRAIRGDDYVNAKIAASSSEAAASASASASASSSKAYQKELKKALSATNLPFLNYQQMSQMTKQKLLCTLLWEILP